MKHGFLVIDDFYDNPDEIRERALRLKYVRPKGVNYPGVVAANRAKPGGVCSLRGIPR